MFAHLLPWPARAVVRDHLQRVVHLLLSRKQPIRVICEAIRRIMSSTSFIPRTVKRRKVEVPSAQGQVSLNFVASERTIAGAATASEDHPPPKDIDRTFPVKAPEAGTSAKSQEAGRSKDARSSKPSKSADLEELAFLVWLSLSDHALWLDADLRRKLTSSSNGSWDAEEGGSLRDDDRSCK